MKVLYLESKKKINELEKSPISIGQLENLPKTLFLAYSIQYKPLAEQIKKQLQASKFKITGFQQVLGCTSLKSKTPILLIGSGRFHALNLARMSKQEVYTYNNSISKITNEEISIFEKQLQGKLSKLLTSNEIGILVSTKPGQNQLAKAEKLKQLLQAKEKKVFLFISNNLNTSEIENFNLDIFVNSACQGLELDNPKIINIDEVLEFFSKN